MKKLLSLLFAAIMVLSVFSGCKKNENTDDGGNESNNSLDGVTAESETLEAVIFDRGNDKEYWEEVISSFETNNPGTKINAVISKDAAYELRDRILAGNSPDFVYLPSEEESGVTTALIKDKAMYDLSDVEPTINSLVLNGVTDNNKCKPFEDGKLYIAPLFFKTLGLMYNETVLTEKGWKVPKTWDDFIALAEECDKTDIAVFGYAGNEPDEFVSIFAASTASKMGNGKLNDALKCDSESWDDESIKTFAQKLDSIRKLVLSGSSSKTKENLTENFKDGKVLFISCDTESYKEFVSNTDASKMKVGFAGYPSLDNQNTSILNVSEMYIPVEAKNISLAKKFLIYQYSDEAVKIAAEKIGEASPVLKLQTVTSDYGFDDVMLKVYNSMEANVFVPQFKVKPAENETLSDEFCDLCVSLFKNDVSANDFQKNMKDYIKDY